MDKIWANRLIAGDKLWDEVPLSRREGVKSELHRRVEIGAISAEVYEEITGEQYE